MDRTARCRPDEGRAVLQRTESSLDPMLRFQNVVVFDCSLFMSRSTNHTMPSSSQRTEMSSEQRRELTSLKAVSIRTPCCSFVLNS